MKGRLRFHNTGPDQNPVVVVDGLDGKGYPGANFKALIYFLNVDKTAQRIVIPTEKGKDYVLHLVHTGPGAADKRPAAESRYERATGAFIVPPRAALVYVFN